MKDAGRRAKDVATRVSECKRALAELDACRFVRASVEEEGHEWSRIVTYGLGSVIASQVSQHQLALALLLKETISDSRDCPLLCYDPAFGEEDKQVLRTLDVIVLEGHVEAWENDGTSTLFYMPHCEGPLYDLVLRSVWSFEALSRVGIVGNSFMAYHELWNEGGCKPKHAERPVEVLKIAVHAREAKMADPEHLVVGAFNNTSLMTFPQASLHKARHELLLRS